MAYMFVKILAPLFTIQPATSTVPAGQPATLVTLVLGGMGLSVGLAARSLRRLNLVELLCEEWTWGHPITSHPGGPCKG
jgi:hypothetical protein